MFLRIKLHEQRIEEMACMNLDEVTGEFPQNTYYVKINSKDHTPAHIHIITDTYNVRFRIDDGETIEKKPALVKIAKPLVPKVKRWLDERAAADNSKTNRQACELEWRRLHS